MASKAENKAFGEAASSNLMFAWKGTDPMPRSGVRKAVKAALESENASAAEIEATIAAVIPKLRRAGLLID
jgi:hypothetical protein